MPDVESPLLRFDGRVAIVTGGGAGIGRAHALLLASRGARVLVNDVGWIGQQGERAGMENPGIAVVEEIRAAGGDAIHDAGDVSVDVDARRMVARALSELGGLHILVNNAGVVDRRTLVQDEPGPFFDASFAVHVKGQLNMVRAAWHHFVEQHFGRILNTGSAATFGYGHPVDGYDGGYAVPKSAVIGVTRQQAGAGASLGIQVNVLFPMAYTPMAAASQKNTDFGRWMKTKLKAEQIANSALWLLHHDCPITGEIISSAGGRVARVVFAEPRGYFNPALKPEDVRDNWSVISGMLTDNGWLDKFLEISSQSAEYAIITGVLAD